MQRMRQALPARRAGVSDNRPFEIVTGDMRRRYAIVGSGIGGLAAAEAIRQHDPRAEITMVSEEPHPFYSRPGLAYLLRGDIPEKRLYVRSRDDLRALGIHRLNARVEQLDTARHELMVAGGRIPYDRLLLATGALAVPPPFPGGDLEGVVKLDGLDDTRRILQLARRARQAVVIGGGITALELAEGLAARGVKVHYFLRGGRYWSDVLDETESTIVLGRLAHEGVQVHLNTQIERVEGAGRVARVLTETGEEIAAQIVAVAIGVRPRADLARQAGLHVERGIVVDPLLQTSAPDVFAAGDVAEVTDPITRRGSLDVLWPTALAQGQVAGANMAGAQQAYVKSTPFNVTLLAGLKTTIIGAAGGGKNDDLVAISRGESETWRWKPSSWVIAERDDVNRVRLVLGERTIVGALVMGDQSWSRPLQRMISAQVDIGPLRAVLAAGGAAALEHLAAFYQRWSAHAAVAG
jgi:NAD(P)H-nitrite reductase large subunit